LTGQWCGIIVLNVHVQRKNKSNDVKDSFYEELGRVFDQFPRYDVKRLLRDFNAIVGRENTSKSKIGKKSLHEISYETSVTAINVATPKNSIVESTMFLHRNIHKYILISPEGKTHNQIDRILIDRKRHMCT
jgi:hypothetical protein